MKLKWLLSFLVISNLSAQVAINTTSVSSAAVLHLDAERLSSGEFGGFLMPIVTEAQQALIPVSTSDDRDDGLMVFVSDPVSGKRCWEVYDGIIHVWRSINCTNNVCSSDILYEEDFDSYAENTGVTGSSSINGNYPGGVTKWTLTSFSAFGSNVPSLPGTLIDEDDFAKVVGGELVFRDTNGTIMFESQLINISGYSDIEISMDIREIGTLEYIAEHVNDYDCGETESDFVDIEYSTDGGVNYNEVSDFSGNGNANHTLADDLSGTISFSVNGISGNTLILRIRGQNWANSEYYFIDNILVTCN